MATLVGFNTFTHFFTFLGSPVKEVSQLRQGRNCRVPRPAEWPERPFWPLAARDLSSLP